MRFRSVFELVRQTEAAAGIVFRSGALGDRAAIAQPGLQLQMPGQVHIDLYLAGAGAALLGLDIDALGNVAPRLDAGARIRGAGRGGDRIADNGEPIECQGFLQLDQRIERTVAPRRRLR